jgi:hypothetical protein
VKDIDPIRNVSTDSAPPTAVRDGGPDGAPLDAAQTRIRCHARALRLGRQLRLHVSVDASGWLRDEAEIVYRRRPDGTIAPYVVRVGPDVVDAELTGPEGIRARCLRYNAALDRLRQLAARLAALVRDQRVVLVPRSAIAYAHHQLVRLDVLIAARQAAHMSSNVVRLGQLGREIEFFSRCDAHLAPIIEQAERAAGEARPDAPPSWPPTPRRTKRRWRRWLPWVPDPERRS